MEVKSFYEQLFFSTVRIEANLPNNYVQTGTGFVFGHKVNNIEYYFVITNKHVVRGTINGKIFFHKSDTKGDPILEEHVLIELSDFEKQWFGHKNDKIDVTILPLVPLIRKLSQQKDHIAFRAIDSNLIPPEKKLESLDAIEDVIFFGYPNDIYDQKHLLPIARKGITATPIVVNFNGQPIFLIDASVFPGSSGSPVFICNLGTYSPKGQYAGLAFGSRIFFLGILSAAFYKEDSARVEIIDTDIMASSMDETLEGVVKTKQMVDLGMVYKSSTIMETIEDFLKSIKTP